MPLCQVTLNYLLCNVNRVQFEVYFHVCIFVWENSLNVNMSFMLCVKKMVLGQRGFMYPVLIKMPTLNKSGSAPLQVVRNLQADSFLSQNP